ncbi:hypothetical protein PUNSTDRAFT_42678 [Punctularia strigosozonata HHB-11173 SS5]|uniref:uncharacterized protein n=1 Tax=Punctularia strigosozonata (strain HHB-11173) TaxID=741275 RepID=UPI0004417AEE|nr:uncharacterized protein PUNSTDRAFT_42678 [Punctularia strigosozonata HHB-11173 SS5]EIN11411.1 hypothetical protein PUNSTDRAFT_42678 [Punctularia strigosozonata HHB-11173 SS5]
MSSGLHPYAGEKSDVPSKIVHVSGYYLHYHALSILAIGIWVVYTVTMIGLLDSLTRADVSNPQATALKETVVDIMSTFFIQAHVPITGMYLARLGMSALQHPKTAPRTWIELFWLADRNWQGPLAIGATYYTILQRRIRPSPTFIMFSLASIAALATPILMRQAWPVSVLDTVQTWTLDLDSFSPITFNNVDSASQRATGEGAWTSGLSILDVYNTSTYLNASYPYVNESSGEYFFAGDAINLEIPSMPGVWISGNCREVQTPSLPDYTDASLQQFCDDFGFDQHYQETATLTATGGSVFLTIAWCSNFFANGTVNNNWMNEGYFPASIFVYLNGTDGHTDLNGSIQCDSEFVTGTVTVNEIYLQTFTELEPDAFFNASLPHVDIPQHPLFAAMFSITQPFGTADPSDDESETQSVNAERADAILRELGYQAQYQEDLKGVAFLQPNLSTMATQLWVGTTHMTAALSLLSRDSVHFDNALQFIPVTGRVRRPAFIALAVAAIGIWFLILVYCTFRMYRPTFSSSLNGYAAARLLADWPELVDGHCCGDLMENTNLRKKFGRVEDTRPDEPLGHIGVPHTETEHETPLDSARAYS